MVISNRRITYFLIAIVVSFIVAIACFCVEKYSRKAFDTEIRYSYESGFYDEPIEVELTVGSNYFITYTLDGRAPNAACTRYEKPILITDASENDNVWSVMRETSLRYFEGGYYQLPEHKVDKCTILRTAAFDYNGNQVSSGVREYFINFGGREGYKGLYNLCVTSDPEGLFDDDNGIYSAGLYLIGKMESCKIYDMYNDFDGWGDYAYKANWAKSGRKSERLATIEMFDSEGNLLEREDCGVRIAGKMSRNDVQKPLRFLARKEYSGKNKFSYDLFGNGLGEEGPKSFMIHNMSQDQDVKLIDYVVYSAIGVGDKGLGYMPMIPCNLFLNGEYWGPMYLMKTVSCETVADNFGVEEDNVVIIKDEKVKIGNDLEALGESEFDKWKELQMFIKTNDMNIPENYRYVCSKIDVENFAKYAAVEIYIGNADWHADSNYVCWRTIRSENNNPYADGKWRFYLYDVNWTFAEEQVIWDATDDDWDFYHMVRCLCKNDDFKRLYLNNIVEMEGAFAPQKVSKIIDEWSGVMEEPIRCNFRRFSIGADADTRITEKKDQIINYCINRPSEIDRVNEWFFNPL